MQAAGPLSHVVIGAAALVVLRVHTGVASAVAAPTLLVNALLFIGNVVPARIRAFGGHRNDGAKLLEYIKGLMSSHTRVARLASLGTSAAATAYLMGDIVTAHQLSHDVLALDPMECGHYARFQAFRMVGDTDGRIREAGLARSADLPVLQRADVLNHLAWTNIHEGDGSRAAQALVDATEAVTLAPDNPVYRITHALALLDNQQHAAVLGMMERCDLAGLAEDHRAAGLCAMAIALVGDGDLEKAGQCIEQAAALVGPKDVLSYARDELAAALSSQTDPGPTR
jgi:hypothetical protein